VSVGARCVGAHGDRPPEPSRLCRPKLYRPAGTAAYHDIILGDTGPYPATPGADFATGIGTFDVAQAVSTVK
jgi:hypothetical protein